ncbi:MAG: ribonuclease HI [Mesorhizobium sp.]|nr:MAG: ribonuclease HI [Mesorhizobium sp.]
MIAHNSIPLAAPPAGALPPGLAVYADGACEPNPGAGGWAFVVYRDGLEIYSECGGDLDATNNTMEMTAALQALRWITLNAMGEPVRLLTDSMYVVNGCNDWRHGWKHKGWKRGAAKALANSDLWQALDAALTACPIKLEWVRGHVGIIGNERADELSLIGRGMVVEQLPTPLDLIRQQLDYSARA